MAHMPPEVKISDKKTLLYGGGSRLGDSKSSIVLPCLLRKTTGGDLTVEEVAVKLASTLNPQTKETLRKKRDCWAEIPKHENVLELLASSEEEEKSHNYVFKCYFVSPKMQTDLNRMIFQDESFARKCTYREVLRILIEICKGVQHLHDNGIIRVDLKPQSILISEEKVALSCFGISKDAAKSSGPTTASSMRKSQPFRAPEIILSQLSVNRHVPVSKDADTFSFGVVMWVILNRSQVDESFKPTGRIRRKIKWGHVSKPIDIWCGAPDILCDLVESCLQYDKKKEDQGRPTMEYIKNTLESMLLPDDSEQTDWLEEQVPSYAQTPECESIANIVEDDGKLREVMSQREKLMKECRELETKKEMLLQQHGEQNQDHKELKESIELEGPSGGETSKPISEVEVAPKGSIMKAAKSLKNQWKFKPFTSFRQRKASVTERSDLAERHEPVAEVHSTRDKVEENPTNSIPVEESVQYRKLNEMHHKLMEQHEDLKAQNERIKKGRQALEARYETLEAQNKIPHAQNQEFNNQKREFESSPQYTQPIEDLCDAAWYGNRAEVQRLLDEGKDVNTKNNVDWTPLMIASWRGHHTIVQILLRSSADDAAHDISGWTALMAASALGHTRVVLTLTLIGSDVNAQNIFGWTALHWASHANYVDIAKALIDADADVNLVANDGVTPLINAAHANSPEIVRALIKAGADVNLAANDGKTPLSSASYEISQILREAGAT